MPRPGTLRTVGGIVDSVWPGWGRALAGTRALLHFSLPFPFADLSAAGQRAVCRGGGARRVGLVARGQAAGPWPGEEAQLERPRTAACSPSQHPTPHLRRRTSAPCRERCGGGAHVCPVSRAVRRRRQVRRRSGLSPALRCRRPVFRPRCVAGGRLPGSRPDPRGPKSRHVAYLEAHTILQRHRATAPWRRAEGKPSCL